MFPGLKKRFSQGKQKNLNWSDNNQSIIKYEYKNMKLKGHSISIKLFEKYLKFRFGEESLTQNTLKSSYAFGDLEDLTEIEAEFAHYNENYDLNRYQNIFSADKEVLKVPKTSTNECGYINGCFFDLANCNVNFYACQAPLVNTFNDFWNMIWQESIDLIVMLTNWTEGSQEKANNYLPLKEPYTTESRIKVELIKKSLTPDSQFITIKLTKHRQTRYLEHLHFISWPDKGTPTEESMHTYIDEFSAKIADKKSPRVLVHCSAGVGRTGVFITIYVNLKIYYPDGFFNIDGFINELRRKRTQMVQTDEQYHFIHKILYDFLHADSKKKRQFLNEM